MTDAAGGVASAHGFSTRPVHGMRVSLVSPERSLYDGDATAVVAPAYDGLVGILPHHAPFLTLLGKGDLVIRRGDEASRFAVSGGFVQVSGRLVRIVVEEARVTSTDSLRSSPS